MKTPTAYSTESCLLRGASAEPCVVILDRDAESSSCELDIEAHDFACLFLAALAMGDDEEYEVCEEGWAASEKTEAEEDA